MHDIFTHSIQGRGLGKYGWDGNGNKKKLKVNPYHKLEQAFLMFLNDNTISAPSYV